MKKLTVKEIKEIVDSIAPNIRISHKALELSYPDEPDTRATIKEKDGYMILICGDYIKKSDINLLVAKQCLAAVLGRKFGDHSPAEFKEW